MSESFICCPSCGTTIEIEAKAVQAELPLGPIELKKLDEKQGGSIKLPSVHHDHEHAFHKEQFEEHEHDHAGAEEIELKPAERDLLDQIEELTSNENRTEHFRITWVKRIRDYPNQVFSSIGETRRMKREGAIRKSVGGTLNWHFETFREAAKKLRKMA